MKRLRAQLAALVPVVAGVFALGIAAPRTALFYHRHAGGEHAHAHADGDAVDAIIEHWHAHASARPHAHAPSPHPRSTAHRHGVEAPARAAYAHDDEAAPGHWHEQLRFHRAVAARAPTLAPSGSFAAAPQHSPTCSTRVAALASHARAPPSPPALS